MDDQQNTLAQVQATMSELFELDPAKLVPTAKLIDDLGLDSIDAIELVARFEETTGHRLREDGLLGLRTVADVVVYLDTCLAEAKRAAETAEPLEPKSAGAATEAAAGKNSSVEKT
jgi:acyl carrier protein